MSGLSRAEPHEAGREDFGDFGQALGRGHAGRRNGIRQLHDPNLRQL
jgi:hypothetical protein